MSIFNTPEKIITNLKVPTEAQQIAMLVIETGSKIFSTLFNVKSWRKKDAVFHPWVSNFDRCIEVTWIDDITKLSDHSIYKLCNEIYILCDEIVKNYNSKQNINKDVTKLISLWDNLLDYIEQCGTSLFGQSPVDSWDDFDSFIRSSFYDQPFEWRVRGIYDIELKIGPRVFEIEF